MKSITAVFAVMVAAAGIAQGQAHRAEIAKSAPLFTWPKTGQTALLATSVTNDQVSEYLDAIFDELHGIPVELVEFAFARFYPGRATLVARYAVNAWPMWVALVDCDGSRSLVHQLRGEFRYELKQELTDVDGDGLAEIITHQRALDEGSSRQKLVGWKQIFKGRADYTLEDVSAKNRAYYEARIFPELDELEAKLPTTYQGQELRSASAQVQFVRDKYRRMLYGEAEAGMANALRWAQDPQEALQELAINVFQDIGTKEAREAIVKLSQSSNRVVASRAQNALRYMDLPKQ